MRPEDCDLLIIGGGPAGLIAARDAARGHAALSVVLLERDPAIGQPVRCGEGVGAAGLAEFADAESNGCLAPWIASRISRVVFRSPDGTGVRVAEGEVGYVLARDRFEPALAGEARAAGAEVRPGIDAVSMRRDGDRWRVRTEAQGTAAEIRARVVIGADGVESAVGRWAGIDTRVPARDMESCAQVVVRDRSIEPDAIVLHFGERIAPGGYAWIFPKGNETANVGLGVLAVRSRPRSALDWLEAYLAQQFPGADRRGRTVGGVIVAPTLRDTVADGVLLCGDAAHMINPLSGGGIVNAMKAGRLAAQAAVAALCTGDTSARALSGYHERWMRMLGDDHVRFHRVKEALGRCDDAFFDALARTVNRIPESRRTLGRIFRAALFRHPALLPCCR